MYNFLRGVACTLICLWLYNVYDYDPERNPDQARLKQEYGTTIVVGYDRTANWRSYTDFRKEQKSKFVILNVKDREEYLEIHKKLKDIFAKTCGCDPCNCFECFCKGNCQEGK